MGGVNHQTYCAVIENFIWDRLTRSLLPLKAVLDDVNNFADDIPFIYSRCPVRQRKVRFDVVNLLC